MPGKVKGPHHRGSYQTQAKRVRDAAARDPSTRCWRCGRTIAEIRRHKPKARWTAGHLVDGMVNGPLQAECSPCNYGAGATLTNRQRARQIVRRTRLTW